jgi:hypothetical protein
MQNLFFLTLFVSAFFTTAGMAQHSKKQVFHEIDAQRHWAKLREERESCR